MDFQFEWDEGKRLSNIAKHGVDFFDAALIFESETIEAIDESEDYGEERIIAYGHVDGSVLKVVYTMRGDPSYQRTKGQSKCP